LEVVLMNFTLVVLDLEFPWLYDVYEVTRVTVPVFGFSRLVDQFEDTYVLAFVKHLVDVGCDSNWVLRERSA